MSILKTLRFGLLEALFLCQTSGHGPHRSHEQQYPNTDQISFREPNTSFGNISRDNLVQEHFHFFSPNKIVKQVYPFCCFGK